MEVTCIKKYLLGIIVYRILTKRYGVAEKRRMLQCISSVVYYWRNFVISFFFSFLAAFFVPLEELNQRGYSGLIV